MAMIRPAGLAKGLVFLWCFASKALEGAPPLEPLRVCLSFASASEAIRGLSWQTSFQDVDTKDWTFGTWVAFQDRGRCKPADPHLDAKLELTLVSGRYRFDLAIAGQHVTGDARSDRTSPDQSVANVLTELRTQLVTSLPTIRKALYAAFVKEYMQNLEVRSCSANIQQPCALLDRDYTLYRVLAGKLFRATPSEEQEVEGWLALDLCPGNKMVFRYKDATVELGRKRAATYTFESFELHEKNVFGGKAKSCGGDAGGATVPSSLSDLSSSPGTAK